MSVRLTQSQEVFFQTHASELVGLVATDKSRLVCLVDAVWHKKLTNWIHRVSPKPPPELNNRVLFKDDKFNTELKYKEDFQVVEKTMWDPICQAFGQNPKVARHYVLDPATNKPTVIINPIQLIIYVDDLNKEVKKAVGPEWKFGPILNKLCQAYNLPSEHYRFLIPDGTKKVTAESTVSKIMKKYPGKIILRNISKRNSINAKMIDPDNDSSATSPTSSAAPPKLEIPAPLISDILIYPQPVGLINLGNTCFFNAAVQCLVRVQRLTSVVTAQNFDSLINKTNKNGTGGKIATAYRNLVIDMSSKASSRPRSPSSLRSAIVYKYRRFADFGQHDAQELLGALLDGLHEDLNQSYAAGGPLPPSPTRKGDDSWAVHVTRHHSPVMEIFCGRLLNTVECPRCGFIDTGADPFVFLSLPVPQRLLGSVTLRSCLDEFAREEVLDRHNLYCCEKCGEKVQAKKSTRVGSLPPVLVIHLKRFSASAKVSTRVEYPDVLDAGALVERNTNANDYGRERYRLIGAVFHHGALGGGHYTAAALDQARNKWYSFDDSYASECREEDAHSSAAYILFYQRI